MTQRGFLALVIIINVAALIFLVYETVGINTSPGFTNSQYKDEEGGIKSDGSNSARLAYVGVIYTLVFLLLVVEAFILVL